MGYPGPPSARRKEAIDFIEKRENIEREIVYLTEQLKEPNGPGIRGNLVDSDGYPRQDINIPHVLAQRNLLARLITDHALITDRIEGYVYELLGNRPGEDETNQHPVADKSDHADMMSEHAESDRRPIGVHDVREANSKFNDYSDKSLPAGPERPPFAIVDQVSDDSPAKEAGLKVGDKIFLLGTVSLLSCGTIEGAMRALPTLLHEYRDQELDVKVYRGSAGARRTPHTIGMKLTPKKWSGRGLLGCHVVPAPKPEDPNYTPDVATAAKKRTATLS